MNNSSLIPLIDSRKVINSENSLFYAIKGQQNDGHNYIGYLYDIGIRHFVIEDSNFDISPYNEAQFSIVDNSIKALQKHAKTYRGNFQIPIIGITGSNGKTIVKEWLSQLLSEDFSVAKSPRSYNSQVGVPLSIFELKSYHTVGIFEAGISKKGEMEALQQIINPKLGILTNIGSAHDEGFNSKSEKLNEKLTLFKKAETLIFRVDDQKIAKAANNLSSTKLSWSLNKNNADVQFEKRNDQLIYQYKDYKKESLSITFSDSASIENLCHCITALLYFGFSHGKIQKRINTLSSISMRMEVKKGVNNCYIIDDAYNNDLVGIKTALELFEQNQQLDKRTIILSDVYQSGINQDTLYKNINTLIQSYNVSRFIGIGKDISTHKNCFTTKSEFYHSTKDFLNSNESFKDEIILLKGARNFKFELIASKLAEKQHRAYLDINLNALVDNLNFYRSKLNPSTKLMVMVKAFAYGSGSNEVANLLQYNRVDYLAVAYSDEGIELRKNGVKIPIMVMNPDQNDFQNLITYKLEPEIYSFKLLKDWCDFIQKEANPPKIHLKIDTGMHRLGFELKDINELVKKIKTAKIKISSIFSHLATADNESELAFTKKQLSNFEQISTRIEEETKQKTIKHILNSSGILNYNVYQFDMVRLGIGLYGFDPTLKQHLKPVVSLYAQISQIKNITKGDTIGYGRIGVANSDMKIATINIGYADGVSRLLSNNVGHVFIKRKIAPIIGNVCMDMLMVDITNINCNEGDKVEIFGENISIADIAQKTKTIPYEILTSVSERVKRIYFKE